MKRKRNLLQRLRPRGKIFRLVSNTNRGTIKVYDNKGKMILEKRNLSKRQIELVEKGFLNIVAKKLDQVQAEPSIDGFDPMIT